MTSVLKRKGVKLIIMKEYVLSNKKGLLLVLIAVLIMGVVEFQNIKQENKIMVKLNYQSRGTENERIISPEEIINNFFTENATKISFYAKAFRIKEDKLTSLLKENREELDILNTDNFDLVLINYLLELEKSNPSLFNFNIESNKKSSEYMLNLLKYYTSVYPDVDFALAAGIAKIESGYRAQYMLSCNNIFGGMSNGKLIKYRTIEYGILRFIILLNDKYYAKGLNTVATIGRVYNPVINEEGQKIASPTWVTNVTKAIDEYQEMDQDISLEKIVLDS